MITHKKPILLVLTPAVSLVLRSIVMATHTLAPDNSTTSPLVMRVAIFAADQGTLHDYREWIDGHLFQTLREVPGYVGTFLGRDPESGQLISISFWETAAAANEGEQAVRRAISALPEGSAPRPSSVGKYVVEFRDLQGAFAK